MSHSLISLKGGVYRRLYRGLLQGILKGVLGVSTIAQTVDCTR